MDLIVLLSGPVAVGKTSLREELERRFQFRAIRSSGYLTALAEVRGILDNRTALQDLGDSLDAQTDFKWLVEDVASVAIRATPEVTRWLVDAVRKERQIEHFRSAFPKKVAHVHLTAPEDILMARYAKRIAPAGSIVPVVPYSVAVAHPNEQAARGLKGVADVVLDTSQFSPAELADTIFHQYRRTG